MDRYAIIGTVSIHIPGDERSRTNPGHGYPEHTDKYETFIEFDSREEWEARIKEAVNPRVGAPEKVRAIVFRDVGVTKEVAIKIDP